MARISPDRFDCFGGLIADHGTRVGSRLRRLDDLDGALVHTRGKDTLTILLHRSVSDLAV